MFARCKSLFTLPDTDTDSEPNVFQGVKIGS